MRQLLLGHQLQLEQVGAQPAAVQDLPIQRLFEAFLGEVSVGDEDLADLGHSPVRLAQLAVWSAGQKSRRSCVGGSEMRRFSPIAAAIACALLLACAHRRTAEQEAMVKRADCVELLKAADAARAQKQPELASPSVSARP